MNNATSSTGQKITDSAIATLGYTAMAAGFVLGAALGYKWMTK